MEKIEFSGYAVSEEINYGTIIWTHQLLCFSINKNIDWLSTDGIAVKTPVDVKYIEHYYPLSTFLFRHGNEKKNVELLNEFSMKRLYLLDDYTYDRLEKDIYPFCAPCMHDCIFRNQHGARLVRCLKKTLKK